MGTWDIGPFDNDTAADWCNDLDDAAPDERAAMVRAALLRAVETDGYLDAPEGEEACAAAALVAAQCPDGEPVDTSYGPDEPLPDLAALRPLAVEALDRIATGPSELMELWEESGDRRWRAGVERLTRTLLPPPAGEQLTFA
ncbi:DUF4259 domain-containing protein [Streptomyces sp. NBC_00820]|uniref:DUF4259 domain-containing protein n=1 Tax=Streptomyces sp. NBC_00820 TaxID=2975842 RepID=UPI002ED1D115|nr:DUF4259 domain-containing protein [Streptomyces sp. NBC_00820]